jgi:methionyl-tRNA formyltransferase
VDVLFLGPADSRVASFLTHEGEKVMCQTESIDARMMGCLEPEMVVSHGYRHILKREVLDVVRDRAVNLHIAFLPWNRGADPNLWSWIEGTPKGVTIHYLDDGIDSGDVIAQRQVDFNDGETLATSYARLQVEMLALFREKWPEIKAGLCGRSPQSGSGTFHRVADRARVEHLLVAGWDTPVSLLVPEAR